MARKIVGITCSTLPANADAGPKQSLNRAYVWAVERAGGVPIILPVTREPDVIARYLSVLDGLMLSGGVDVDPGCYGQTPHPHLGDIDLDRDATELPLIRAAFDQDMPIFAICRGIQALNVALGGTLYQDLPSERPSDIGHEQNSRKIPRAQATHSIAIEPYTRLAEIAGAGEMQVNSFHHQALRDVAAPLVVTALAPDGVIEAVESRTHRYVVGVQFHPEETSVQDGKSQRLFDCFVQAL
jgi:putative glutamine amidotransferase